MIMRADGNLDGKSSGLVAALIVIGSFLGNMTSSYIHPERTDPFTGEDAKELRKDLREYADDKFELRRGEIDLQIASQKSEIERMFTERVPPAGVQSRIRNLERWAERQEGSDFEVTTYDWH